MDPVGHLVEYIEKNRVNLALVQSARKRRLGILTAGDRQAALPLGRVLLMTPAAIDPQRPRQAIAAYLQEVDARREALSQRVEVPVLWELVQGEGQAVPLAELAELVFGPEAGDDHQSAVLRALFYDRLHFRLAGGQFVPLTPEQLEQKRRQREHEAAYRAEVDRAVAWLKALPPEGPPAEPAPEGLLALLRDLVVFEDEAPQARKAKEIVALAELGGRRRLFRLLVRLGVFRPHENLFLLREGVPVDFPPEVEEAAAVLALRPSLDGGREDLTGLFTFTIDGELTADFDDALSFEPEAGGGGTLGVHITDAAALLPEDGPLEQEARERATTIYLPETRVPMLPPRLSEDALSLRRGELRPAVSCLARLDAEGHVREYRICRSLLKVDRRLTYQGADALLESEPRLKALHAMCLALRRRRAERGAHFLPLPEVVVSVDEQFRVSVQRIDRDGPSRDMVAETAILANSLFGRFLAEHEVPALFRTQAPPREPIEEGDPSEVFMHFRQRRLLNRVELATAPGLHSSLGVEHYTHATSPIRRYLDLVMQRQLARVLSGREPYSARELEEIAMQVEPNVRRAMRVRQARQRYWLLCWLQQQGGRPIEAIVMEYQTRRWQLLLPQIMLLTTVPSQPGLSLEPGQVVQVRVEKVDPFYDQLRVSLV